VLLKYLQFKYLVLAIIKKREESEVLLHKWYNHVDAFRCGNFNDAPDKVKIAWITFVDNILAKVNSGWKDSRVRSNKMLSEHITTSDEAYAVLISSMEMDYWVSSAKGSTGQKRKSVATIANDEDGNEDEETNAGGSVGGVGSGENPKVIDRYYDLYESIQSKRSKEDEGISWEIGYRDAITMSNNAKVPSSVSVVSSRSINSLGTGVETEPDGHHGGKSRNINFETSW
jgi:hypothetical protein